MIDSENTNKVEQAVAAYCKRYGIVPEFEISGLYHIRSQWRESLPNADHCGCYLFYSSEGKLLYIGKVSLNHTLGGRFVSYFKIDHERLPVARHVWSAPPIYAQTIRVHEPFEAPSLEEFLIQTLNPSDNVRKGGQRVRSRPSP